MRDLRFGVVGWGYRGPKIARNLESLPRAMVTMIADADERRLASLASNQSWVEFAERQHCTLMVGHTFQYSPVVNELRKLIQGGDLGKIYSIEAERPGIPDIAHIDLDFAGGMTAHVHVSWLYPCKVRRVTVIGDARMAVYDDTNPAEMLKVYNKGADVQADPVASYRFGAITIPHIDWIEPLRLECEDFAHAIRTGARPRADGRVGREEVQVLARIQDALQSQESQAVTTQERLLAGAETLGV